jgi:hypothetical protein
MRYLSYQGEQVKFIGFWGYGSWDSDKVTEKFMMRETGKGEQREENQEPVMKACRWSRMIRVWP